MAKDLSINDLTPRVVIDDLKRLVVISLWKHKPYRPAVKLLKQVAARWIDDDDVRFINRAEEIINWLDQNHDVVRLYQKSKVGERPSPEYLAWRRFCARRDHYTCQLCGSKQHLHVHHRKSYRDYHNERVDPANGVTLCQSCHQKVHRHELTA